MAEARRVLLVCTHNSARSQMAEGWLRELGGERFEVFSAGLEPGSVRPEAVEAMSEAGIDISDQVSEALEDYLDRDFDWVITVCDEAAERCPVFPRDTKRRHWSMTDPSLVDGDSRARAFRRTRDRLRLLVEEFLETEDG